MLHIIATYLSFYDKSNGNAYLVGLCILNLKKKLDSFFEI